MKTKITLVLKKRGNILGLFVFVAITALAFNPVYAQTNQNASTQVSQNERIIKGLISDETGPLEGVNVLLKGTKLGVVTSDKGEFTFPKPLKTNDVLLVSYLGYETVEVLIKDNTTFVRLELSEDLIEFIGEVNTNKIYKSKRSKNQ